MNCLLLLTLVIIVSLIAIMLYKQHESSLLNKKEPFYVAPIDYRMSAGKIGSNFIKDICKSSNNNVNKPARAVEDDDQTAPTDGAPINYNMSANSNASNVDYDEPAPLNYKMGEYDSVRLDTDEHQDRRILVPGMQPDQVSNKKTNCGWRHAPCNLPLMGKNEFYTPDGKTNILKDDITTPYLPSVNGNPDGPKKMFMFAYNQCRPECCPSTYSCDHGCVCTDKQQREYLARRGAMKQ